MAIATLLSLLSSASATALPLTGLRSLIVGGGPSGLLLAHRLLDAGGSVSLLEGRPDPRAPGYLEGRAYALGLGLRGRTAIRTVDEDLWQAVAATVVLARCLAGVDDPARRGESVRDVVVVSSSDMCVHRKRI